MKDISQSINLQEIDYSLRYQGFYWDSNSRMPFVLEDALLDPSIFDPELPFIVEGQLYAAKQQRSLRIRFLDGKYHVTQFDLSQLKDVEHDEQIYFSHRTPGFTKYRMIEAWESTTDALVEDFQVLTPSWSAFAGFIK